MKSLKDALGTAIGFLMVLVFSGTIVVTVLGMAFPNTPSIGDIWTDLRCVAGFPSAGSACARDTLRQMQAVRNDLHTTQDALQKAQIDRDLAVHALAGQNLVFTQGPKLQDGVNLVVGSVFGNDNNQSKVVRSFCWVVIDNSGLDPRVTLAVRDADGTITPQQVSKSDLSLLQMAVSEVDAARNACPWTVGIN